jgi:hypothetical protein
MPAISFLDFDAPTGWTEVTALPTYSSLLGMNVQPVCKTGNGFVWWGGNVAPAAMQGIPLHSASMDYEQAIGKMWLWGPATYAITQRL